MTGTQFEKVSLLGNPDVDALMVKKYRGTGLYNKVKSQSRAIAGLTLEISPPYQ